MKIDGKQLAGEILENLKQFIFGSHPKMPPAIAVILVGRDPASLSYIKQKQISAEKIGAKIVLKQFPKSISPETLNSQLSTLNLDPSVHGIIIQRPLPPHIDKNLINESVSPSKDIDGFHPKSQFTPPVGLAVIHILKYIYALTTKDPASTAKRGEQRPKTIKFFEWTNGQKILLLGRGETGGKPIANTMDKLKIKYTQTHSKTKGVKDLLKHTDIIISAVGKPNLITGDMIKKGAICIGVGISRLNVIASPANGGAKQSAQKLEAGSWKPVAVLTGDFDEITIASKASFYTSTPGGIGPLTVAFLLDNLLQAYSISC